MLLMSARSLNVLLLVLGLLGNNSNSQSVRSDVPVREVEPATRHLIICVDGVGFSTLEKMRAEGKFQGFRQPSKMIAPFPTLTNVSMSEILESAGASDAAGYEDSFYDAGSNRLRGGLLDRFNNRKFIRGTFRELFDYHPSAIKSGLGYALPPVSTYVEALTDLVRLKQKFNSSRKPVFFAYVGSTDSLAHLGGERMVRSFLSLLDESVKDIISDGRVRVEVTIFSDHGNHYRKYKRVSLKSPLRKAGFKLEGSIRDGRSVVLPQFGLIGCALLFTREENEARLASVAAQVRGVDFAMYEQQGIVRVVSRNGAARIERRGERFRYRMESGDPLELKAVLAALTSQEKTDAEGFIADADWFAATKEGMRPDVVRRVYEGATGEVRNRANVIVSFEDGYYSGSYALDIFAFLQATHGNVMREQSCGFVMTTKGTLPAALRACDVWEAIGEPALKNSKSLAYHAH
jgi:hypothetical protein